MAPSAITEDYYMILEVDQDAAPELIVKSYKRLALKLHPDRNAQQDATEAFQRLSKAYETLKDEVERRKYDLIYPSLKGRNSSSHARASNTSSSTGSESAQIAALRMSKQKRADQWRTSKMTFDTSISKVERIIRQLEQEINGLISILAAEAAEEARKNSWGTWIMSPIYKKVEDSDEVKARKDRARQERRIEKDMKERRMQVKKAELSTTKASMNRSRTEIDAADLRDDAKIRELQNTIWRKESLQRQEKERQEREIRAREMRQQQEQREKREREAAEARRQHEELMRVLKQQQAEREAEQWRKTVEQFNKRREEFRRQERFAFEGSAEKQSRQHSSDVCRHGGWWPKVEGHAACPECYDSWTYLLQCPGCAMKACPKCQAAVRPNRPEGTGRRRRMRMRTPSPTFDYDEWGW